MLIEVTVPVIASIYIWRFLAGREWYLLHDELLILENTIFTSNCKYLISRRSKRTGSSNDGSEVQQIVSEFLTVSVSWFLLLPITLHGRC